MFVGNRGETRDRDPLALTRCGAGGATFHDKAEKYYRHNEIATHNTLQ